MFGQSPAFWWSADPTFAARLLSPLASLYGAVSARRMRRPGSRVGVPVICIGNFVAGGAGKTPVAIAVAQRLLARGASPAFLSRGYGRSVHTPGVLQVDPDRHDARSAGDEPLLLARVAPTFVAGNRRAAVAAAIRAGATVLVLDDGLQSPSLAKDASIVVVDGLAGTGNGLCHPAGPLRAPLTEQWRAVSLLCVLGQGRPGSDLYDQASARAIPVLRAELRPHPAALQRLRGRRLYAFAGIGRPRKFFATLESEGLSVVGRRGFPDHHAFSEIERSALLAEAARLGADLVTTEKDRVRLPADYPASVLPISMVAVDETPLDALLARLTAEWIDPA